MNFKKVDVDIQGLEFWRTNLGSEEVIRIREHKTDKTIYPAPTPITLTKTWEKGQPAVSETEMLAFLNNEYQFKFEEAYRDAQEKYGEYCTCFEAIHQEPKLNPINFSKLGIEYEGWLGFMQVTWIFTDQKRSSIDFS